MSYAATSTRSDAILAQGGQEDHVLTGDGRQLRTAFFPVADAVGHVLLLNGRTEFIEKHLETVAALHERRLSVWTLDWRGQGLSDRLLNDAQRGYVDSFDDFIDDLGRFVNDRVVPGAAGAPLILLAHSMGGNIGLRFLHQHQDLCQRAVFSAPMVAFHVGGLPRPVARVLAAVMCLCGRGDAYAIGQGPAVEAPVFEGNPLTSCPERFARLTRLLAENPALRLGGVTWAWLRAALRSTVVTDDPGFARAIRIPVQVCVAQHESIVDNQAIRRFVQALPAGTITEIQDARHELLCERDAARQQFWHAFDQCLAAGVDASGALSAQA